MKKLLSIIGVSIVSLAAHAGTWDNVNANEGWYVWGNGSYVFSGDSTYAGKGSSNRVKHDSGYAGSLAVGYDFGEWMFELEGAHFTNKKKVNLDGGFRFEPKDNINIFMFNAYYKYRCTDCFSLYAGIGVGYGHDREHAPLYQNGTYIDTKKASFHVVPVQYKIGAIYSIDKNWELTAGVRFVTVPSKAFNLKNHESSYLTGNIATSADIGLRYKF